MGDRRPRGRAHGRSIRTSERSTTSTRSSRRPSASGWRSPSTSRSSARPTTRGSRSTRNGSTTGPTGRSGTPRTRRRSIRTSTRSTSTTELGRVCGPSSRASSTHWIAHGVKIFRVDNPHTKPFPFWEWVIDEHPRRAPRRHLPRRGVHPPEGDAATSRSSGFTQSYTYFTWRNEKWEIEEYLTELTQTEMAQYFRPNFFANTPDILHEYLQAGGPPAFKIRLVLAALLSPSYGIYSGYELFENVPRQGRQRGVPRLGEVRAQAPRLERSRT